MQVYEVITTNDLKEIMKHGTNLLPLEVYKTSLNKTRLGYAQLHWHDEIQFAYVLKGKVIFNVNNVAYLIEPNNGIFINSKCLHGVKPYQNDDCEYICLVVHQGFYISNADNIVNRKYLDPFLKSNNFSALIFDNKIEFQNTILEKILKISEIYEKKHFGYELEMQFTILNLIYLMITNYDFIKYNEQTIYSDNERTQEMLAYIENNYSEKITLENMAKNVNLCQSEFCRFFKKTTGQTPFEYLNSYRINQSTLLLRYSNYSIIEIASIVGFANVSYYTNRFKKQMNCTPKQYRNFPVEKI